MFFLKIYNSFFIYFSVYFLQVQAIHLPLDKRNPFIFPVVILASYIEPFLLQPLIAQPQTLHHFPIKPPKFFHFLSTTEQAWNTHHFFVQRHYLKLTYPCYIKEQARKLENTSSSFWNTINQSKMRERGRPTRGKGRWNVKRTRKVEDLEFMAPVIEISSRFAKSPILRVHDFFIQGKLQ